MSIQHQNMVFEAGGLSGSEKLLLLAYCNYTDAHGYCWAGVERIADDIGASVRTVKRTRGTLIEKNLLGTKRRINPKTGQAIPNLTRVNLPLLATMKRARRAYDDNAMEQITFAADPTPAEEDATPAEEPPPAGPKPGEDTPAERHSRQSDTRPDQHSCHSGPSVDKMAPAQGQNDPCTTGAKLAPNPSVHPSSSSSAAEEPEPGEDEDEDPSSLSGTVPTPTPVAVILRATGATTQEAHTLVDQVRAQPGVRSVARYVQTLVTNGDMAEWLAKLRAQNQPRQYTDARCRLHEGQPLPCRGCALDARVGSLANLREVLETEGPQARPDLAELLEGER